MKVYLIRHAQSEENILDLRALTSIAAFNDIIERSRHAPLTAEGEQQARAIIEQLSEANIQRLYSSPFKRALTTATILGDALGLTPQIVEDLHEVLPGAQRDRGRSSTLGRHFVRSYTKMLWPWSSSSETWASAYRRGRRAWAQITAEPADEIAAVAHRGLLGVLLLSLSRSRRWRVVQRDLSNGGISVVMRRGV